jgi:hypothetical protein
MQDSRPIVGRVERASRRKRRHRIEGHELLGRSRRVAEHVQSSELVGDLVRQEAQRIAQIECRRRIVHVGSEVHRSSEQPLKSAQRLSDDAGLLLSRIRCPQLRYR